jgi:hypothetical protein
MKQCTYCGKEHADTATACAIDGQPLMEVMHREPGPFREQGRVESLLIRLSHFLRQGARSLALGREPKCDNRISKETTIMDTQKLNKICFTLCIVTVVLATLLAFALIWGSGDKEFLWKGELSVGVLFLASAVTLSVSKSLGGKANKDDDDG